MNGQFRRKGNYIRVIFPCLLAVECAHYGLTPRGAGGSQLRSHFLPVRAPLEPAPGYAGEGTEADMETSEYIAALIGPVLMATSLSLLFNRGHFDKLVDDIATSPALIYIAGVTALVIGLAIVRAHNIWVWDWQVLVTIFGWMAIIGGLIRILAPQFVVKVANSMVKTKTPISAAGIIGLPIGGLLTAFGFGWIS